MARLGTILRIDDLRNPLIGRKMLLEKAATGVKPLRVSAPTSQSRPYFSKWLDQWKHRNKTEKL